MRSTGQGTARKKMYQQAGLMRDRGGRILLAWFVGVSIIMMMNLFLTIKCRADAGRMEEEITKINCRLVLVQEKLGMTEGDASFPSKDSGAGEGKEASPMGFRDGLGQSGVSGWSDFLAEEVIGTDSYAASWGLETVDRPRKRNSGEVLQRLRGLGEKNELIAEICRNHLAYPDKLLEALANNPEMAGFVSGYQGNEKKASGGLTEEELSMDFPLFLQWDPRWGYVEYGEGSCIGLVGCGPTCLSMALYYLTGDDSLTPDKIAAHSMTNGYYVPGAGTAWALLTEFPAEYGVKVSEPGRSEQAMKQALDQGKVIICSFGGGDFTAAGHFAVIYGYDEDGFRINDPNCVARSRKHWEYADIAEQIKHIWVMGKETGLIYENRI